LALILQDTVANIFGVAASGLSALDLSNRNFAPSRCGVQQALIAHKGKIAPVVKRSNFSGDAK
jgi:hypothetical protein